jgi:uncharacterized radical SAM superfamily Fe-S cluster-containing enzyme
LKKIKKTKSLCPECHGVLVASIYEDNNKVYIRKKCPEHGEFTDLYWGDYELFRKAQTYEKLGTKLSNPKTEVVKKCPYDCGICPEHKSHTVLGIIDVTNRCNLRCPICFAHAGIAGYLYEPTKKQIRGMLETLRSNSPIATPALQFSGGEPTVRDDLPELIRMARDFGFKHIEVNSNGIKMAESIDYCKSLKEAGLSTIYLQFDGLNKDTCIATRGLNLIPIKKKAIDNLRKAGFTSVVLVPVLVGGLNEDEVGTIIQFAIENHDIVRCINFQPVAITGRINRTDRDKMRITIPDLIQIVEKQTKGFIKSSDWYAVPAANHFTNFLGNLINEKFVDFSVHPHCGMATYLVVEEDGSINPITNYFDIDKFLESLKEANERLEKGQRTRAKVSIASSALTNMDLGTFRKYIYPLLRHGDYHNLSELHHRMIMIGSMHFMDPYNFDLERVERCCIHYATPDNRLIPFCTMNTIHRQEIENKFAKPLNSSKITPLADVDSILTEHSD